MKLRGSNERPSHKTAHENIRDVGLLSDEPDRSLNLFAQPISLKFTSANADESSGHTSTTMIALSVQADRQCRFTRDGICAQMLVVR